MDAPYGREEFLDAEQEMSKLVTASQSGRGAKPGAVFKLTSRPAIRSTPN